MLIKGKYSECEVFCEEVECSALSQIQLFLDHPAFCGLKIRIMPDCHAGSGAVIGFTSTLGPKVIPNLIGVDIGCGVLSFNLGPLDLDFAKVDQWVRNNIPSGFTSRSSVVERSMLERAHPYAGRLFQQIAEVCLRTGQNAEQVKCGIGTLGGGNHFIEIGQDEESNKWLTIHSGSRGFGLRVANFHQNVAKRLNPSGDLSFLEGSFAREYFTDLKVAQEYAATNRLVIGTLLLQELRVCPLEVVESVHNYIDFDLGIIRKGAISAKVGERVVIPWNMRDGLVLGVGKGSANWNYSAPHGAGRLLSRGAAKRGLTLEGFKDSMRGVWTSSVSEATLDEAPAAYKNFKVVEAALASTVTVTSRVKTLYNFKAS